MAFETKQRRQKMGRKWLLWPTRRRLLNKQLKPNKNDLFQKT